MRITGTYLDEILAHKREEIARDVAVMPEAEIGRLARAAAKPRDALAALSRPREGSRIIAEVKLASPSKGIIRADLDPIAYAHEVEAAGCAAISVLTDERFFRGSFDRLTAVRARVAVPVLCKDFILTTWQIKRARAVGADFVLLIVAALEPPLLADLLGCARAHGMEALVEVHDAPELSLALDVGARIIGVNNRSLRSFDVSLETSVALAPLFPEGVVRVSESGIYEREDIERLEACGYDAFLVGEALVRAEDPGALLRELMGRP